LKNDVNNGAINEIDMTENSTSTTKPKSSETKHKSHKKKHKKEKSRISKKELKENDVDLLIDDDITNNDFTNPSGTSGVV